LKRDYKDVKYLRDNSGFGWDDALGLPIAPQTVWASITMLNKNYKKFRTTPFPLFTNLALLLDGAMATGEFSLPPPGIAHMANNNIINDADVFPPADVYPPTDQYIQSDRMDFEEYQQAPVTIGRGGRKVSALDDDISIDSDDSDNMMPRTKKPRQQQERRSAGSIIGEAKSKLVVVENAKLDQVKKSGTDPHERIAAAIHCLMENYGHMDGHVIANLADKLGEGFNATIFLALGGNARDAWVEKLI
ncbi:hypothetical protein AaE_015831, partial [Aphanomyces astaci]